MERYVDHALVLSSLDYGEADRVVTLLTRGHGRVSAFANGARKSKRRFAGALEPTTYLKVQLVETRGDTSRLDGADIQQSFHHVRDDLGHIARAMYCLELCRELTRDGQPHEVLFDALLEYLRRLDARQAGPTSLLKFELDALDQTGFMPRFSPCAGCGGATGPGPRFDPDRGGVLCAACATRQPGGVPMSPAVAEALASLQAGARVPLPADIRAQARALLNVFIAHHLGRTLKSVEFMEQVGTD